MQTQAFVLYLLPSESGFFLWMILMYDGWIREYRKLLDNPLIKKPLHCHLWNVLLLLAQHKRSDFIFGSEKWVLEPGQLLTGRKKLSELSGVSESQVERILKYLENEQQITQLKTNKFRIISIVKWVDYQQKDSKRTTEGQQKDTYKNDKNVKNDKKVYIEFVKLTDSEHSKLVEKFGSEETEQRIAALNDYIGSKGKRYSSHYHTILTWARKDAKDSGKTGGSPKKLDETYIR